MRFVILTSLVSASLAFAATGDYVIYRAKNRPAEELVQIARPLFAGKVSFSSINEKIVMDGSQESISGALKLFSEIDSPPRKYRLSVRVLGSSAGESNSVSLEGDTLFNRIRLQKRSGIQSRGGVAVEAGGARVNAQSSEGSTTSVSEQSVVALEGRPVFVGSGSTWSPGGVSAKIQGGESLTLQLGQKEGSANPSLVLQTEVTLKPGEWRTVGEVGQNRSGSQKEILGGASGASQGKKDVQVRVDVLP
jgi:hypothetical protein